MQEDEIAALKNPLEEMKKKYKSLEQNTNLLMENYSLLHKK